jgi:hypothetical protein
MNYRDYDLFSSEELLGLEEELQDVINKQKHKRDISFRALHEQLENSFVEDGYELSTENY